MPALLSPPPEPPRRRWLLILPVLLILAAGGWWWNHRGIEETDDAQVQGNITDIASRIPGTIATVAIHDNQTVQRGQLLVTLDRRDAEAAVRQAEADLQVARREAAAQRSQADSSLNAAHAADGEALAGQLAARAELERAGTDLQRMERLVAQGAVAVQEADAARARPSTMPPWPEKARWGSRGNGRAPPGPGSTRPPPPSPAPGSTSATPASSPPPPVASAAARPNPAGRCSPASP